MLRSRCSFCTVTSFGITGARGTEVIGGMIKHGKRRVRPLSIRHVKFLFNFMKNAASTVVSQHSLGGIYFILLIECRQASSC
jgi:hypothetical protein